MAPAERRTSDVVGGTGGVPAAARVRADPLRGRWAGPTVEQLLFSEGHAFHFFQAIRLLEKLSPQRKPIGRLFKPSEEVVRVRSHVSLNFPPSEVYEISKPASEELPATMSVWFMGLTGVNGVMPLHYAERIISHEWERRNHPERYALRDWLDMFNHRLISLFYRAWEKYRFYIAYERGEARQPEPPSADPGPEAILPEPREPDPFTRCLFGLIGLGIQPLRGRLQVTAPRGRVLARIDDLALLRFSGFLSHRPRCATSLAALLRSYFGVPVEVRQFQGRWLWIDRTGQSRLGDVGGNNRMGVNLVAGERVWDVQSKFRLRLGPLGYKQFSDIIPDRRPVAERKAFFLLCHLTRLYVGVEMDFDVQVVLRAAEVPECQLGSSQLGWNSWVRSQPMPCDADDAVFAADTVFTLPAVPAVGKG